MSNKKTDDVLDMYPLTPMQQGMLFEALYAPHTATYFEQQCLTLEGPLDASVFQRAWQAAMDRHAILRTLFLWERRATPLQVVRKQAKLPWQLEDLSGLPEPEQESRLLALLEADRTKGFVLTQAPLLRCTLIRSSPRRHHFVLSFHHILLDGWSASLLYEEVFAAYYAARTGQPLRLSPVGPFRDFIGWLKQQDPTRAEPFWRQHLRHFPTPTPLIADRRATGATATVGTHTARLAHGTQQGLQALARSEGLTLNTLFLAAWAILLGRYSGEKDVLFGVVVSGRSPALPGVERIVGLLINTVPARVRIDDARPLSAWLKELQSEHAEREQYGHCALSDIHGWSEVPRGQRLFDTLYAFENYPLDKTPEAGAEEVRLTEHRSFSQTGYALTIAVAPDIAGRLAISILYDEARFGTAVVARMAGHYQELLRGIAQGRAQAASALTLLTAAERQELLVGLNQTRAAYPAERCIHHFIEAHAAHNPGAEAVVFRDQRLTYSELDARANQLAHHLRSLGVLPASLVGLCIHRSLEMVVGALAILKAGAAYVPLDPNYPQERIDFVLRDTGVQALITLQPLQARLANFPGPCVRLDADHAAIAAHSRDNPSIAASAHDRAYVIYTSGSTGTPKGVVIEHRSVVNLSHWYWREFQITAKDRCAQISRFSFDASVWEIWSHLMCGASIHLIPRDEIAITPTALRDFLIAQQITVSLLTTSLAEQIFLVEWPQHVPLRWLLLGGDKLHRFTAAGLPFSVVHVYGPTETTVLATFARLKPEADAASSPPIGRPLDNTQLYILDEHLAPVPIGVIGELYVGGDSLARGYHDRPELSAERFIANPFRAEGQGATSSARLYKTGDRVRYLPETAGGLPAVEFIGRADQQVKVRGFRIEPGEIEARLLEHAAVREVTVIAREDEPGQKRLVAYVVATDAEASSTQSPALAVALRSALQRVLPDYMLPAIFVFLDALPLTHNGKIDRRALPLPSRVTTTARYEAPQTDTEQKLAEILREVLKLERVGRHDHFFALGGDSILSILVVNRARQAGLRLTPRDLFLHPTLTALAAVAGREAANPSPPAAPQLVTGEVPLLPIQRWFFAQSYVEPHHFNQAHSFLVPPELDLGALQAAARSVQAHHDALRARYVQRAGVWQQSFAPPSDDFTVGVIDLGALPAELRGERLRQEADRLQGSLSLSGSLMSLTWFDCGPDQPGHLLWIIHHLVVDSISWRLLEEDLDTAYAQQRRGERPTLPAKTASVHAWAEELRRYAGSAALKSQRPYWTRLAQAPVSALPVDAKGPAANQVASEAQVVSTFSAAATRALLTEAQAAYHTRINDLLLTALALALHDFTGSPNHLIDLEGHGREGAAVSDDAPVNLSRTVGWFTSVFPFLLALPPGATSDLGAAIRAVKEALRALPDRGLGYGVLRYFCDEPLAELPRAQLSFNYLGQFAAARPAAPATAPGRVLLLGTADADLGHLTSPRQERSHLLGVVGWVAGDELRFEWSYSERLHRAETIQELAARFKERLLALIEHCCDPATGGYTPSDFPAAGLTQDALDELRRSIDHADPGKPHVQAAGRVNLDAIFPLTPSQHGMLLGSVIQRSSDLYMEQLVLTLHGPLRRDLFMQSGQRLIDRHAALRTGFGLLHKLRPVQYTLAQAQLPWHEEDWRGLPAAQRQAALASYLDQDRRRGFRFDRPPLLRMALLRTGDEHHQLVLTQHHVITDGWSLALILHALFALYGAACAGVPLSLPPAPAFQTYVDWLGRQDLHKAEAFWREQLRGFVRPLALRSAVGPKAADPADLAAPDGPYRNAVAALSREDTAALRAAAVLHRVTMSTLVRGAWALLLSRCSGEEDIVFGATCSGRPADLSGVEAMVGMFISTLPVRILVQPDSVLGAWLRGVQDGQQAGQAFEHCSAGQVQPWSEIGSARPLYDSLLVYENYPVQPGPEREPGGLRIEKSLVKGSVTHYPLTLLIECDDALDVRAVYDGRLLGQEDVERVVEGLLILLRQLGALAADASQDAREVSVRSLLRALPADTLPAFAPYDLSTPPASADRSPRDHYEAQVAHIWQSVFGQPVGLDTDFFALGGHSLSAIQIMTKLEQLYRRNLSAALLFKYPTIAKLAKLLRSQGDIIAAGGDGGGGGDEGLLTLGGEGPRTPLFLSPGGGSDAIYFYELAQQLGAEQPIYGLRPPGLDGSAPARSVEESATRHIASMRRVQPRGPYLLLGHSSGAHVAYEIAQQLLRQGEEVALLAVLDMFAPITARAHLDLRPKDEVQALISYAETLQPLTKQKIELTREQLLPLAAPERILMLRDALVRAQLVQPDTDPQRLRAAVDVAHATGEMVPRYTPQDPRPVPVVLFRVDELSPAADELTIPLVTGTGGWAAYGPTIVHTVPGNHFTLVNEPHVAALGALLEAHLAQLHAMRRP